MQNDRFDEVIDEILDNSRVMLTRKNSGYSKQDDRIHNFRVAAALNGCTMEQALWGMLTKHIVSIRDMVQSGESYSHDIWDEKLGDAINYLAILKAITVDKDEKEERDASDESLMNLREKLTGSRHPSEAPAEITITHSGDILTRNQNVYSTGIEAAMTNQQRDLESVKRVADKLK